MHQWKLGQSVPCFGSRPANIFVRRRSKAVFDLSKELAVRVFFSDLFYFQLSLSPLYPTLLRSVAGHR